MWVQGLLDWCMETLELEKKFNYVGRKSYCPGNIITGSLGHSLSIWLVSTIAHKVLIMKSKCILCFSTFALILKWCLQRRSNTLVVQTTMTLRKWKGKMLNELQKKTSSAIPPSVKIRSDTKLDLTHQMFMWCDCLGKGQ